VGLLDAENCACFYLCEAATVDDAVDLQSEMGLELLAFGIGETNIGKSKLSTKNSTQLLEYTNLLSVTNEPKLGGVFNPSSNFVLRGPANS
jgi:hypothetical protein